MSEAEVEAEAEAAAEGPGYHGDLSKTAWL